MDTEFGRIEYIMVLIILKQITHMTRNYYPQMLMYRELFLLTKKHTGITNVTSVQRHMQEDIWASSFICVLYLCNLLKQI